MARTALETSLTRAHTTPPCGVWTTPQFHVEPNRFKANVEAFSFVPGRPNLICMLFAHSNTVRVHGGCVPVHGN